MLYHKLHSTVDSHENLGIKKPSMNVYIDSRKYYIFVRMTKQITSQRDFLKKLLETL